MRRNALVRLMASRELVRGRIFSVLEERVALPSGLEQELLVIEHPGAVAVLPVLDDGRVILVRQYRHAVGEWLLEIPAGRLERAEAPESAARRELEEETAHRAEHFESLGTIVPAPGFCSEELHLFAARGARRIEGPRAAHDADEEIELVLLPPREALTAVERDAKSWIALRRWLDRASG